MRRVVPAAVLSGILSILVPGTAAAVEGSGGPAGTPAPAPAPAAGSEQEPVPDARSPGQAAAAPAGDPAGAAPCADGTPPRATGPVTGSHGYGPWGAWRGPWPPPLPARPPLAGRLVPTTPQGVTVETDADDRHYYVIVHLDGLDAEEIHAQVRGRGLVIFSGRGWERRVLGPGSWQAESRQRYFRRYLPLPGDADPDRMRREPGEGVLRLVIPRHAN